MKGTAVPAKAPVLLLPKTDAFDLRASSQGATSGEGLQKPLPGTLEMTRTTSYALAEMDQFLGGKQITEPSVGGAQVRRDGEDVDSWQDIIPGQSRYQAAQAQLKANEPLEQEALARFSPSQRESYLQVKAQQDEFLDRLNSIN